MARRQLLTTPPRSERPLLPRSCRLACSESLASPGAKMPSSERYSFSGFLPGLRWRRPQTRVCTKKEGRNPSHPAAALRSAKEPMQGNGKLGNATTGILGKTSHPAVALRRSGRCARQQCPGSMSCRGQPMQQHLACSGLRAVVIVSLR